MLGLGKALTVARKDCVHAGHPLVPLQCRLGADDVEWIPAVATHGWVVVLRDRHVRTRPVEVRALHQAGLRSFWIANKRDQSTWQWLTRLVYHWERIEHIVATEGAGPWAYAVNEATITHIAI